MESMFFLISIRFIDQSIFVFKDIFKAKDDEIDDLKRKVIDLRDQLQMHLLEGQRTDVPAMNKVNLLSNIFF
jgi:hypothetical protein